MSDFSRIIVTLLLHFDCSRSSVVYQWAKGVSGLQVSLIVQSQVEKKVLVKKRNECQVKAKRYKQVKIEVFTENCT